MHPSTSSIPQKTKEKGPTTHQLGVWFLLFISAVWCYLTIIGYCNMIGCRIIIRYCIINDIVQLLISYNYWYCMNIGYCMIICYGIIIGYCIILGYGIIIEYWIIIGYCIVAGYCIITGYCISVGYCIFIGYCTIIECCIIIGYCLMTDAVQLMLSYKYCNSRLTLFRAATLAQELRTTDTPGYHQFYHEHSLTFSPLD